MKDSLNVEGTIKDQLTRIHELEDEVSQLQHAMSNTAAQLTGKCYYLNTRFIYDNLPINFLS